MDRPLMTPMESAERNEPGPFAAAATLCTSTARLPDTRAAAEPARQALNRLLQEIVGTQHVLVDESETLRYRTGFRFGHGPAVAVVLPGSLVEQWRVLEACVRANVIVLSQATNTGLTGGSTPDGDTYDRPIVIVSMTRLKTLHLVDDGKQVVCLPGVTLNALEQRLKSIGREPHSVIGSSCLGASVIGGICNNSGGALVNRGPAYTEMTLHARVDAAGVLQLVNHLGIALGTDAEDVLQRIEQGTFSAADVAPGRVGSDHDYAQHVRDIDADTPARFNADARRLFEGAGSAGKVMLFAVRLDTFPIEAGARVFYIGTHSTDVLTTLRRDMLRDFRKLPIAAEYMHREAFDVAERYGKDMFLIIDRFGTDRLPGLFALKARCEAWMARLGFAAGWMDRLMQSLSTLFPAHLPPRIQAYRDRYPHHLMVKVAADAAEETRDYLVRRFGEPGAGAADIAAADGAFFECSDQEGRKAFLHRFVAAGAAVRYRAVEHARVEDIVALDIALPRNSLEWMETLPQEIERKLLGKLYYGHFLCYVLHQDYIVKKGEDCLAIEHAMWELLDARGAEYPAEHNVGHLYPAKPALKQFYQDLDPCNCFNPGIGKMSKFARYQETAEETAEESPPEFLQATLAPAGPLDATKPERSTDTPL